MKLISTDTVQEPITVTQSAFLEIVNKLNLRFPVADIYKKTKIDKGTISKVLNKELPPSNNFLSKFAEAFDLPPMTYTLSPNSSGSSNFAIVSEADRLLAEKDNTIKRLEADNAWLRTQLEKFLGTSDQQKS